MPELLVGIFMGMIVIIAALSLLQVVNRGSARTVARVDANQQARPVMERIMDELRSTCVRRSAVPILAGSTATSMSFLHETGSDVSPVPDKRTITLASGTLTERAFPASPATPNADGTWSFSTTATSTRQLLTKVAPANVNGNASTPLFQYFTYVDGVITALTATPSLSAADAARTVQVKVSFGASPLQNPTGDSQAAVSLSDTALLRFSPPSGLAGIADLPCA